MVQAVEHTVQNILEGTIQYTVPIFQRVYQWGDTQLQALWDDIKELALDRLENESASHFVGSLVFAQHVGMVPGNMSKFLMVDGQQRMTTITLLLAAIRDALREESDREADRIHDMLLVNKYQDGEERVKFLPTLVDRASYVAIITEDELPRSEQKTLITRAYKFFRKQLVETIAEGELTLVQVESAVSRGLSLVSISADPGDNVHRIFQSLNNTGLALTQADLIRNEYFMRMPNLAEASYREIWVPMERRLPEGLEGLFWADNEVSQRSPLKRDIFREHQLRISRMRDEEAVRGDLARISDMSKVLERVMYPDAEEDEKISRELANLAGWKLRTPRALIMTILRGVDRGGTSSYQASSMLRMIESFLVRRILTGKSDRNINNSFRESAWKLLHKDSDADPCRVLQESFLSVRGSFATDEEVRKSIGSQEFYLVGKSLSRRNILIRLEESFNSKEPLDMSNLTIEHVMPQKLTLDWRADLARLSGDEAVDISHGRLVHTLGNLTLTGYNSELSNRPFSEKRELLRSSGVKLSQPIAVLESWGPDQIEARNRELAERIIALWPGPGSTRP